MLTFLCNNFVMVHISLGYHTVSDLTVLNFFYRGFERLESDFFYPSADKNELRATKRC